MWIQSILVSKTIMIERGVWGPLQTILVIFIQSGAIVGKTNGYINICLDIMSQKEEILAILKHIFDQRRTVYSDMCLH